MKDNWFLYLIAVLLGGGIAGTLYYVDRSSGPETGVQQIAADADQEIIPLELPPISEPVEGEDLAATSVAPTEPVPTATTEDTQTEIANSAEETPLVDSLNQVEDAADTLASNLGSATDTTSPGDDANPTEIETSADGTSLDNSTDQVDSATDSVANSADSQTQTSESVEDTQIADADTTTADEPDNDEVTPPAEIVNSAEGTPLDNSLNQMETATDTVVSSLGSLTDTQTNTTDADTTVEPDTEDAQSDGSPAEPTEDAGDQASVEPRVAEPGTSPATEKTAAASTVAGTNLTIEGNKPEFDVVRVDQAGNAVVAGTAEPNSTVSIMADGEKIGEATANASGEFVAILSTQTGEAQNLELESELDGQLAFSDESILILPSIGRSAAESVAEESAPIIVKTTPEEVVVVQPGGPALVDQVVIDSISYGADGDQVIINGRGTPNHEVFLYVNNTVVANTMIAPSGVWRIQLKTIDAGNYTMRADEIDANGQVVSRMETPFQRAYPADVQAAQSNQKATHIVQPGNSLWLIATNTYGDGLKYHQIFQANQDQIRNPDLIYPGQVFVIPDNE